MIDPGEALFAEVGIRAILERRAGRISAGQIRDARRMEPRIARLASKLVRGTLDGAEATNDAIDYDDLLKRFSEPPTEDELETMIRSLAPEDHEDAGALLYCAGRAYSYLQQSFPVSVRRDLIGSRNLEPSSVAMTTFEFALSAVDRPLGVFDLIDSGALLSTQAKALRACFPTLTAAIVEAIKDRVIAEMAEHRDYDPPFALALSTLAGDPYADPKVTTALAAAGQLRDAKRQAARQQPPKTDRVAQLTAPPSAALD